MNFDSIKDIIEKADAGAFEKTAERRGMLKSMGGKILLASAPLLASSFLNKANAQTTNNVVASLNQLLKIERLLYAFYKTANEVDAGWLIPKDHAASFKKIENDDQLHVKNILYLIDSLSGAADPEPADYDFTGGGLFPEVMTKYADFLSVAQMLKDTSLRAYKGILLTFIPKDVVLSIAMGMHSVEAKHAAYVRIQRRPWGVKPWITGNETGIKQPGAVPNYANDENTTQAGIQIIDINGFGTTAAAASEAFDEPLIPYDSMPLFNKFIK